MIKKIKLLDTILLKRQASAVYWYPIKLSNLLYKKLPSISSYVFIPTADKPRLPYTCPLQLRTGLLRAIHIA